MSGLAVFTIFLASGFAQTDGKLPEFEIATVKPIDPRFVQAMGVNVLPGGRVAISDFPLKTLIMVAFRLSYWQTSGGEAWMEKENFDVEAQRETLLPGKRCREAQGFRGRFHLSEEDGSYFYLHAPLLDRTELSGSFDYRRVGSELCRQFRFFRAPDPGTGT